MGWQSDWLYRLIFDEVTKLWIQAQQEGAGKFGPAPDRFYIQQFAAVHWEQLVCQPPVTHVWSFEGTAAPMFVIPRPFPTPDQTARGMFFRNGVAQFHITENRQQIVWNHRLGRRYGRGKVLRVRGQGQQATLEGDPAFGEWVS